MIRSLGFIPDGSRRWSTKNGVSLKEAYSKSIDKVFEIADWCKEFGINTLIIWGFSTENWKRDKKERDILFDLFKKHGDSFLKRKESPKIEVVGRLYKFPKPLQELFNKVQNKSANSDYKIKILLNYGGNYEIVSAINQLMKDGKRKINQEEFENYLWIRDNPELVIRTGGTHRLSGFLPYQTTYSELYFDSCLFPDFSKENLKKAIVEFESRDRRFGN